MINKLRMIVWDRRFTLPVAYECYENETVTDAQVEAINNFAAHLSWIESARTTVEKYCKEDVFEDDTNSKKDNIFSYIKPETVFVKRDIANPRVALMCKYRYDPEHGLAIVFASDGSVTVGIQDIIL